MLVLCLFILFSIAYFLSMCLFLTLPFTTPANNHTGRERGFHFPSGGNKCRHRAGGSREHYSARQENHRSAWWVAVSWQLANVGIQFLCSYSALHFCFACGYKSVSLSAGGKKSTGLLWYITPMHSIYCFGINARLYYSPRMDHILSSKDKLLNYYFINI